MKTIWYYLHSETDATDAALYVVRVGASGREFQAHAELCALAIADETHYYCKRDRGTLEFVNRLFEQNPDREVFVCSPVALLRFIKNRANAEHVKNLSERFRARRYQTLLSTHQTAKIWKQKKF